MKTKRIILLCIAFWVNASFILSQTPILKFITKYNDIDLQNIGSYTLNLGDTLLFTHTDSGTLLTYLNICYDNKCLQFNNTDLGIENPRFLGLRDAVHVNKNNNILWIATIDGLFMFDGIKVGRNSDVLVIPESPYKNLFQHSFYKHSNGDIYISNGVLSNLIKYDGNQYEILVSHLSDDEIKIMGKHPQATIVAIDDKLFFRTIHSDVAYLDLETHEYRYPFVKDTIIQKFLSKEELFPKVKPMIGNLRKYGDKLFLHLTDLMIGSFFFYDGEKIEKVMLDTNLIFPNDSTYILRFLEVDSKDRIWAKIQSQKSIYPPYDSKTHFFIINNNFDYFRINNYELGFENSANFFRLHNFSNGTTYLSITGGFLVDDPLGVSVEETESTPSFFMTRVMPNPFKDRTQVELTATSEAIDNIEVEIFDYLGKSIKKLKPFVIYQPMTGKATLDIETDGIAPGYYFLVVTDNHDTRTMPIIIK